MYTNDVCTQMMQFLVYTVYIHWYTHTYKWRMHTNDAIPSIYSIYTLVYTCIQMTYAHKWCNSLRHNRSCLPAIFQAPDGINYTKEKEKKTHQTRAIALVATAGKLYFPFLYPLNPLNMIVLWCTGVSGGPSIGPPWCRETLVSRTAVSLSERFAPLSIMGAQLRPPIN